MSLAGRFTELILMKELILQLQNTIAQNVRNILETYQVTDNQKTELPIRIDGVVLKKGKAATGYDYSVFNKKFYNDFGALEIEIKK